VRLADELVERRRPQPLGERRRGVESTPRGFAEKVAHPLESMLLHVSEVWSVGSYERLAARLAPVQDQLVNLLEIRPGDRVLDLATGTGEVAVRAARLGATVTAIDVAEPMLVKARTRVEAEGLSVRFDLGDVEYLPYEDACFDVLVSNFGLIFAPDHANVAAELARVSCAGGRLGFTAWKPNPKLGELYRRFTEDPIEGREAYEWGREDHVEDMLGEHFELDFEDGTLWLEGEDAEEIWRLFSESAPPMIALLRQLDEDGRREFHRAFVALYESYRTKDGAIRAPRRYLLVLGRRK
jgi:SAM-dependent methyltransferase